MKPRTAAELRRIYGWPERQRLCSCGEYLSPTSHVYCPRCLDAFFDALLRELEDSGRVATREPAVVREVVSLPMPPRSPRVLPIAVARYVRR